MANRCGLPDTAIEFVRSEVGNMNDRNYSERGKRRKVICRWMLL